MPWEGVPVKKQKEMIAVRLDPADRKRVGAFARRLGVREADMLRYAIKMALQELSPLSDQALEGAALLEAFIAHGPDMARWLELDEKKLDAILHKGLEDERLRVSAEDIRMVLGGRSTQAHENWRSGIEDGKEVAPTSVLIPSAYLFEKYVVPIVGGKLAEEAYLQAQRFKK